MQCNGKLPSIAFFMSFFLLSVPAQAYRAFSIVVTDNNMMGQAITLNASLPNMFGYCDLCRIDWVISPSSLLYISDWIEYRRHATSRDTCGLLL